MNNDSKLGFTLIELAIVLVIVGLLIGGILVAKSIIQAAKLSTFVSQMQSYEVGINNFENHYKRLPGDSPLLSPAGNGDGKVYDLGIYTADPNDDIFNGEIRNVWKHMSDSEMIDETYTNTNLWAKPGKDVPQAKYGPEKDIGIYFMSFNDDIGNFTSPEADGHAFFYVCYTGPNTYYGICSVDGVIEFVAQNASFLPVEALAFDAKTDDGRPSSGNVRAGRDDLVQFTSTPDCDDGTSYNIANTTIRACAIAIKYGSESNAD